MAEAVALAASVAGLASLADSVFRSIFKFTKHARSAKEEIQKLASEVQSLAGVLHQISLLASTLEEEPVAPDAPDAPSHARFLGLHHAVSCQQTLGRIEKVLLKHKVVGGPEEAGSTPIISMSAHLRWPFSVSETKDLISELGRRKETLTLSLSASSLTELTKVLSLQRQVHDVVEETRALASIQLGITTRVHLESARLKVLAFFLKYDPEPHLAQAARLRHPLTGSWLFESEPFIRWVEASGSRLWLNGIPGSGKTVLAAAMVEAAIQRSSKTTAVAYFFCHYSHADSQDPVNVLSALASQLARQHSSAFAKLDACYQELNREPRLARALTTIQRLTTLLFEMLDCFDHVLVIIDGLDECKETALDMVEVLAKLTEQRDSSLNLALFSRNEQHIRNLLEDDFEELTISASQDDLAIFTSTEVERRMSRKELRIKSPGFKDQVIRELVQAADGMFLWVSCQIDYLCELQNDAMRKRELKSLPPTLHGTYQRILTRVNALNANGREIVRNTLLWIAFADPPLSTREMCQALWASTSLDGDEEPDADMELHIDEIEVAIRCSSLIRKSFDGENFEFAHFTVREFLSQLNPSDTSYGFYHLSASQSSRLLAVSSLRFLTLRAFTRLPREEHSEHNFIQQRYHKHPFYEYAALNWPLRFAECGQDDDHLVNLSMSLIGPDRSLNFLAWACQFCLMVSWAPRHDRPKYHYHHRRRRRHSGRIVRFDVQDGSSSDSDDSSTSSDSWSTASSWTQSVTEKDPTFAGRSSIDSLARHAKALESDDPTGLLKLVYSIRRSSFTPLHMAAALGMSGICARLIGAGADVNLQSEFGSPLQCGIMGLAAFDPVTSPGPWTPQGATVSVLVDAGAKCPLALGMSMLAVDRTGDYSILSHILRGQAALGEGLQDFLYLCKLWEYEASRKVSARRYDELKAILDLLSAATVVGTTTTTTMGEAPPDAMGPFRTALADATTRKEKYLESLRSVDKSFLRDLDACARYNDVAEFGKLLDAAGVSANHTALSLSIAASLLNKAIQNHSMDIISYILAMIKANRLVDRSPILPNLRHHISAMTAQDDGGNTIWHLAVHRSTGTALRIISLLFESCRPSEWPVALRVPNQAGRTPLAEALVKGNHDAAMLIASNCVSSAGILRSTDPPAAELIADLVSVDVFESLQNHGHLVAPDSASNSPLFYLNRHADPATVSGMLSYYPYQRADNGDTPLDSYLKRNAKWDLDIVTELTKQELVALGPDDSFVHTWETVCGIATGGGNPSPTVFKVLRQLVVAGGLLSYETRRQESGLGRILPHLTQFRPDTQTHTTPDVRALILDVISHSKYPKYAQDQLETRSTDILHWAIIANDIDLLSYLADEHKADVHQKVNARSALELCCLQFQVLDNAILAKVLSLATKSRLDELDKDGRGLLHLLAPSAPPPSTSPLVAWHAQCSKSHCEHVKQLLAAGANPNLPDGLAGERPLSLYLRLGLVASALVLLESGASYGPEAADGSGVGPLSVALGLHSWDFLKVLVSRDPDTAAFQTVTRPYTFHVALRGESQFSDRHSLLHEAAFGGNTQAVCFILDHKLQPDVDIMSPQGLTPLHLAALASRTDMLRLLVSRGANVNMKTHRSSKEVALHLAVRLGRPALVRALLDHGALHLSDGVGRTPLQLALQHGKSGLVPLFLESILDQCRSGEPLCKETRLAVPATLEHLIEQDDLERCKVLFSHPSLQDIRMTCQQCSPLLYALGRRRICIANWLMRHGSSFLGGTCTRHGRLIYKRARRLGLLYRTLVAFSDSNDSSTKDVIHDDSASDSSDSDDASHSEGEAENPPCFFSTLDLMFASGQPFGHLQEWLSLVPDEELIYLLNVFYPLPPIGREEIDSRLTYARNLLAYSSDESLATQSLTPSNRLATRLKKSMHAQIDDLLPFAVLRGDVEMVKLINKQGIVDMQSICQYYCNLLSLAVSRSAPSASTALASEAETVKYLIDQGLHVDSMVGCGDAPLGTALSNSQSDSAALLARRGADYCLLDWNYLFSNTDLSNIQTVLQQTLIQKSVRPRSVPLMLVDFIRSFCAAHVLNSDVFWRLCESCTLPGQLSVWSSANDYYQSEFLTSWRACRRLGKRDVESVHPLLEHQTSSSERFSLLSLAAATGRLACMDELMAARCDIEFEDSTYGTPLMAAASRGRIEAVQHLVRRGALIQYQSKGSSSSSEARWTSAVLAAAAYPCIVEWLLAGRFTDQAKLKGSGEAAELDSSPLVPWSGITSGQVLLLALNGQRHAGESSLRYAVRLSRLKRDIRGWEEDYIRTAVRLRFDLGVL